MDGSCSSYVDTGLPRQFLSLRPSLPLRLVEGYAVIRLKLVRIVKKLQAEQQLMLLRRL